MYSCKRRAFAAPVTLGELLGQVVEQDEAFGAVTRPCQNPFLPPGHRRENLLETLQGTEVTLGRGRLLDAQHPGRLGGGQLLEVAQRQDLAVDRVECVERLLEPEDPLGPDDRLGRRRVPAEQLGRQRGGARRRQGAAVQRDLPAGVAHLGAQVVPVQLHQPLADHQAEPEEQRELRIAEVLLQPLGHLDVRLLDHVRGVEPSLQARVEADLDHPAQAIAVALEQGVQRRPVPRPYACDQFR